MRLKFFPFILFCIGFLIAAVPVQAADEDLRSLKNISQELVKIRQEIAQLHDQIRFEKETFNDEMRAFSNQRSDLEVKSSRADLNIKELQVELEKLRQENAEKFAAFDQVSPVLLAAIEDLRQTVAGSLPFKLSDRLQALDDIEHRLETSIISPNKAANQLWAFVEDELILGRSSGIYNETLEIDGESTLVKVLRVGKVAMFYRSSEGDFGVLRKKQGQWQKEEIKGAENIARLEDLFDSFTKNLRNGMFAIPNIIPQG